MITTNDLESLFFFYLQDPVNHGVIPSHEVDVAILTKSPVMKITRITLTTSETISGGIVDAICPFSEDGKKKRPFLLGSKP